TNIFIAFFTVRIQPARCRRSAIPTRCSLSPLLACQCTALVADEPVRPCRTTLPCIADAKCHQVGQVGINERSPNPRLDAYYREPKPCRWRSLYQRLGGLDVATHKPRWR